MVATLPAEAWATRTETSPHRLLIQSPKPPAATNTQRVKSECMQKALIKKEAPPCRGLASPMVLAMRLTVFFTLAAILQVSAKGLSQTIHYSGKEVPLKKVFAVIKKQTGYVVFYDQDWIKDARPASITAENLPLETFLQRLLKDYPLEFTITGKTIILSRKPLPPPHSGPPVIQVRERLFQTVTGRVTDAQGSPLSGATISVKDGKASALTGSDGRFRLQAVEGDWLVISFIGFQPKEVKVSGTDLGTIVLSHSDSKLDEVQIIAYGTTTRRLNTGSVSTVKGEELEKQPATDPIIALEGKVPGLFISQSSGVPGSNFSIKLRGQNSLRNGNDPLYIVDGIPFPSLTISQNINYWSDASGDPQNKWGGLSPFNNLNPSDIESIDVLKDADATAIYGSRGANGVILITTKKGKPGKTHFDLNVSTGAGKTTHKLDLMNTQQYLQMRREAFKNDGKLPGPADYDVNGTWDTTRYTDWQKILIGGTARLTNIQAGFSGGNTETQFSLRGGYTKQTSVFPGDNGDERYSILLTTGHTSLNRKFHANASVTYVRDRNVLPSENLASSIKLAPDAPAWDTAGNIDFAKNTFLNPLRTINALSLQKTENLLGALELSYMVLPGLQVKGNVGINHLQDYQSLKIPITYYPPPLSSITAYRQFHFGSTDVQTWNFEPQINYQKVWRSGKLDVLVASTFQESIRSSASFWANDFSSDAVMENVAAAGNLVAQSPSYSKYRYNAVSGRVTYNWKDRYLVNLTARRDGSSRFGPGNRFGNFGSMGAAWIFSEHAWVRRHLSFINFGKVRGSYGIAGNDQIGDYQYLSTYSFIPFGYQGTPVLLPDRISNPNLQWELVRKLEFGLEAGFWNNKLLFNLSWYRNRTGNQLVPFDIPTTTGFYSVQFNLPATVQNSGIEADVNADIVSVKNFSWKTSANISIPRDKLLSYQGLETSSYSNVYNIGKSAFSRKYYQFTGVDPKTGLYTVTDANKDGLLNYQDLIVWKFKGQRFFGGWQNTFTYKGIQLDISLQFVRQTGQNYDAGFSFAAAGVRNSNVTTNFLDRWQKPGDIAAHQRFTTGNAETLRSVSYYNYSDALIVDASYIRLRNLMLSWDLPGRWLKKAGFRTAKIYVQGQNLLTITGYKGLDPETQAMFLPPLRMFNAGMQISL